MIPEELKASLDRYAEHHVPTGGFLHAVLANDLFEAVGRADQYNAILLPTICRYIWNELPATCWGSPEKVKEWLSRRVA